MNFVYRTERDDVRARQSFEPKQPIYRLNEVTNLLVEDGSIDIDELIASALPTQLDELLETYLPTVNSQKVECDGKVYSMNELQSNLDFMQEAYIKAQECKERYGLDENLSVTEVFSAVQKLKSDIDDKLKEVLENEKVSQSSDDKSKGVLENEKSSQTSVVDNSGNTDNQNNNKEGTKE